VAILRCKKSPPENSSEWFSSDTEHHGIVVAIPVSYSGGPRFVLDRETGCPDRVFLWISSLSPGKFRDSA
jgi:hypothetical protein